MECLFGPTSVIRLLQEHGRGRQTGRQRHTDRQTDRQQASRDTGREADGVSWFFFSSGARPLAVARVLVGIHRWAAWLDECCATISERSKGIAMLAAGLPNELGAILTEFLCSLAEF